MYLIGGLSDEAELPKAIHKENERATGWFQSSLPRVSWVICGIHTFWFAGLAEFRHQQKNPSPRRFSLELKSWSLISACLTHAAGARRNLRNKSEKACSSCITRIISLPCSILSAVQSLTAVAVASPSLRWRQRAVLWDKAPEERRVIVVLFPAPETTVSLALPFAGKRSSPPRFPAKRSSRVPLAGRSSAPTRCSQEKPQDRMPAGLNRARSWPPFSCDALLRELPPRTDHGERNPLLQRRIKRKGKSVLFLLNSQGVKEVPQGRWPPREPS